MFGLQAAYLKEIDNHFNKNVLVIGAGGVSPSVILSFQKLGINFGTNELMFIFVILNFILVNLLYISVWKNMEFESSYRYIISCFHIIFVSLVINLSKFEETSKF